ncbi:MAG TPA: tRNA (adenine-N1)-methyltransferase, partial [Candidatus Manganitrophaceae bacterium]|nr:tRNA (adenine-N1)-methyltransferase [Candidatus Manganitrophaceae bacterium]
VFQFSGETIAHDAIIGREDGTEIVLSRGSRFFVIRPTLAEYTLHMPRGAQILYPKDLALILMWADIYPGATVIEAGVGSGALTTAMLQAVGEKGRVISYEIRDDFARRAKTNIETYLGPEIVSDRLRIRPENIYDGIAEEQVDRIVLDLPEPHRVVPHAVSKLRAGGIFLSFLPTVPQVELVVSALRREPAFEWIETFETLLRDWNIDGRSVRPNMRMVAHSGFITTARRIQRMPDAPEKQGPSEPQTEQQAADPDQTDPPSE